MASNGTELAEVGDVAARVRERLAAVWENSTDEACLVPTETQEALALVWADVQALVMAQYRTERLLESTLETAADLRYQRDVAVRDAKFTSRKRAAAVIHDLARYIGHDAKIAPADVALALSVLVGEDDLPVSRFVLEDFYEALRELATEAFAEEEYRKAADAEYEAEVAASQGVG